MNEPKFTVPTVVWRGASAAGMRCLPEETAIALTYDRRSFAVMMASPQDLEDFALGFSLSEGIIETFADILSLEIITLAQGIECRMELAPGRREALDQRRRYIAGPAGCGLCGMDSLDQAIRPPRLVPHTLRVAPAAIAAAVARLATQQHLNHETRAVHAAGIFTPAANHILVREDVGRHNALDKAIGAAARLPQAPRVVLVTSRVSIELIQKAAMFGAEIFVAVSVPSARAVRDAEQAGMTLVAIARDDGFEVFTHGERLGF
ncbi:MAG: formate dehydrogenase accessory sulfurtransferase FdhD [Acidocella sp.]|nr:formate dehydrogenase accessory sulfurtransferase FdhD [Acidocella sp.]